MIMVVKVSCWFSEVVQITSSVTVASCPTFETAKKVAMLSKLMTVAWEVEVDPIIGGEDLVDDFVLSAAKSSPTM